MAFWSKRVGGHVAALAVMAALVAGCSQTRDGADSAARRSEEAPLAGRSALSGYLAGRLAQGTGDSRAAADYYASALKYDPENGELLQRTFSLMAAEGRMDVAAPLAERVLAFDSDSPLPLLVAGLSDAQAGRWIEAEGRFSQLPKRGVNSLLGPLMLAWTRAGQGRADAADALIPLTQTKGLELLQAFHAALIADLGGRSQIAEDGYRTALSAQLSVRGIESAGSWYQRNGRLAEAAALYTRYQTEHPDSMLFDGKRLLGQGGAIARTVPDARAGLAEALFDIASLMRQGNATEMSMLYARLALWMRPELPLAQTTVADLLVAQNRLSEANRHYLALDPALPAHTYGRLRAAINQDEQGDTSGALDQLDRLAKDRPDSLEAMVTKGDILRRRKRFAEAAEAYTTAIGRAGPLEPHHWALLYSRAICLERSKQWPKAEADFLEALRLKPDQADVLNYLGYSWVDMGLHLEKARKMLEKAVELRPKDGAIIDSMGWALYRLGDYHGAVRYLERAAELKPEDPTINDHLGDAYWQVGRVEEAMFQWLRANALDPEPEQIEPLKVKIRTGQVPAKPLTHP
jgi:tetratricopeptide (TPR) repeat protein